MQYTLGDECRSGRRIPKPDRTSCCTRKTSNRKKKHIGKDATSLTCTVCANGPDGPDAVTIDGNTASTCTNDYDPDSPNRVYRSPFDRVLP